MAIYEVRIPDIGGAAALEIIEILVNIGEVIEKDAPLLTLESDKATMEVPSPLAGTVKEIRVAEGSTVSEGDLVFLLEVAKAAPEAPLLVDTPPAVQPSNPSRSEPEVVAQPHEANVIANVAKTPPTVLARDATSLLPYASPSIRVLARELAVPLAQVPGSGEKGRITREDIYGYVKAQLLQSSEGNSFANSVGLRVTAMPSIDYSQFGPIERQSLSRIQKISGANLHRNWVNIPHVTNHDDADVTELENFRQSINLEQAKTDSGIKLTMVALLIKASVAALKRFRRFNASLDGDELVFKHYFHIGFAADTPNGLVVPVLRDADQKGLLQIAKEVAELSAKARSGKLTSSDMSGGCFSISSLGGIGGSYFTPIINAPEIAILGVGKARNQMIWSGTVAEPRLIMPLSLSWDHRAVDGAMAGQFNAYLCALLADYRRALL